MKGYIYIYIYIYILYILYTPLEWYCWSEAIYTVHYIWSQGLGCLEQAVWSDTAVLSKRVESLPSQKCAEPVVVVSWRRLFTSPSLPSTSNQSATFAIPNLQPCVATAQASTLQFGVGEHPKSRTTSGRISSFCAELFFHKNNFGRCWRSTGSLGKIVGRLWATTTG